MVVSSCVYLFILYWQVELFTSFFFAEKGAARELTCSPKSFNQQEKCLQQHQEPKISPAARALEQKKLDGRGNSLRFMGFEHKALAMAVVALASYFNDDLYLTQGKKYS